MEKQRFEPRYFMDTAKKIFLCDKNNPNTFHKPTLIRIAIGRFYYSAFLTVREMLADILPSEKRAEFFKRKGELHFIIPKALKLSRSGEIRSVGDNLAKLRNLRNQADYSMVYVPTMVDYHRARLYCEAVFEAKENLKEDTELQNLVIGVLESRL